jgi:hypothetical protein
MKKKQDRIRFDDATFSFPSKARCPVCQNPFTRVTGYDKGGRTQYRRCSDGRCAHTFKARGSLI